MAILIFKNFSAIIEGTLGFCTNEVAYVRLSHNIMDHQAEKYYT